MIFISVKYRDVMRAFLHYFHFLSEFFIQVHNGLVIHLGLSEWLTFEAATVGTRKIYRAF